MFERGQIRNDDYARRLRDFSGLRWGRITPTDIDAFVEFSGRLFVIVEGKFKGSRFGGGQRIALERLCDAVHRPSDGRYAVMFVVEHDGTDKYDYSRAMVTEYRWKGAARKPEKPITLFEAIDFMRNRYVSNVRSIDDARVK